MTEKKDKRTKKNYICFTEKELAQIDQAMAEQKYSKFLDFLRSAIREKVIYGKLRMEKEKKELSGEL